MGSRLDRLILLLDTGSTPSVRLTAARQLGAIAATRVSHPSTASHGHASVSVDVKLEEGAAASNQEGIWRGVDGEWDEVAGLVARVLPYLQSRSMETRQAAASALGFISRGAGIWDPSSTAPSSALVKEENPSSSTTPSDNIGPAMSLRDLELPRVLAEGTLLLASSGAEYGKLSALTAEELARAQKDALKNLGLGFGGGEDDIGVDVGAELAAGASYGPSAAAAQPELSVEKPSLPPPRFKPGGGDLINRAQPSGSASLASSAAPSPAPDTSTPAASSPAPAAPDEEDEYAGLSARERNKLKRKRKAEGKAGAPLSAASAPAAKKARVAASSSPTEPVSKGAALLAAKQDSDAPGANASAPAEGKVVVDPAAKAAERARLGGEIAAKAAAERAEFAVKAGEWPWRACVERLAVALLAPAWETRHGAALGLREVLRLQGGGGGKLEGLTKADNEERHRRWCEDLGVKLLCVFALDRFGDYVSDQVIAPVRETAAQALAILLPYMPISSVREVQRVLVDMVHQHGSIRGSEADTVPNEHKYVWQVRHSGLLGLKYFVAVLGELVRGTEVAASGTVKVKTETEDDHKPVLVQSESGGLLKPIVDAALVGLRDRDDDVRSAAAATLVPLADALVDQLPAELKDLVDILWACLGDLKDDLASSVGGVMDLLAKLLSFSAVLDLLQSPFMETPLPQLIPRLFPFFRHTITSVRLAVLNTVLVFLELPGIDSSWVDDRLLRLMFQNLILEERLDVRAASEAAWSACLAHAKRTPAGLHQLGAHAQPHLATWCSLLYSPIGTPINSALLWSPTASLSGQGGVVHNVDKPMLNQDLALVTIESITRGKVSGATVLGRLIATWPIDGRDATFAPLIEGALASPSALQRFLTAVIIEEWATAARASGFEGPLGQISTLAQRLVEQLHALLSADAPTSYSEMDPIISRLRADSAAFYAAFGSQGKVPAAKLPSVPDAFGPAQAQLVANSFNALLPLMQAKLKKAVLPALEERQRKVLGGIAYFEAVKTRHDRQVYAALGGAVIALQAIPAKITPLIRSVTNSIKMEENVALQARSARAIAALIDMCSSPTSMLRVNPADKLVKNLCAFLCQDVSRTPIFSTSKSSPAGILTLEFNPARGTAEKAAKDKAGEPPESDDVKAARLVFRGAQLALSELAERFGPTLLERVPKLWSCMADALMEIFASGDAQQADAILAANDQKGQDLIDALTVLPVAAAKLTPSLHKRLASLFPALSAATRSRFAVVRYAVAKSFATLCVINPIEGLRHVVESVVPVLGDPLNADHRRGAIELISHLVELLDVKILPYVIFLVVPVLGRMSDPDDEVRLVATNTFASLVKLVPLEAGLPDPPGFSDELLSKREIEREFLMQLLDGSKVAEYKVPVDMGIELRKYQRDGVSWLAFLARYQLHGLLCDDMGLGKTLQSITILASMHHERAERFKATNSPDSVHLPSLIVCPPTLTGHWKHEINTYAPGLRCVIYTGPRADRDRLLKTVRNFDAVILSYDVARNDIEVLSPIDWHYCILDEGHIIKNGKTKLTKAVKSLKAIHRLILSGTPIQNNVLELWSLFDFLMPGFLGSEKAFNDRFGKPIAASRDAKSSSKEQEAGALALEALHKQVLPFILRRLKEDVLDDLPPKIIQDYHVELSPLQKQLYDDFSGSQAKQAAEGEVKGVTASGQKPQHVFQALQYLRKLVNHPALVYKPEVPQHQAALVKVSGEGSSVRDIAHAPKLKALQQILLDCGIGASNPGADSAPDGAVPQHRALIFCQLKSMLDIVENDLLRALMPSVTYMRLDGLTDVSKRHAICQTFNADPSIDCLLLTTHVGGLGLNLTGADTVIFVEHDWNPMKDLQAMDRAHRLGQKKIVNVYRLIMRGTLEEKIMGLQRFKLNIASTIVSQQNSDLSLLGTDQILDLFQISDTPGPSASAAVSDGDKPMSQKAVLESLEDLPVDSEYNDLDLAAFMAAS